MTAARPDRSVRVQCECGEWLRTSSDTVVDCECGAKYAVTVTDLTTAVNW
mgnify:CR=1 FL=1